MENKYTVDDVLKVLPELPYPEWSWGIEYEELTFMSDDKYYLHLYTDYSKERAFSREIPLEYGTMYFSSLQKTAKEILETVIKASLTPNNVIPSSILWELTKQ